MKDLKTIVFDSEDRDLFLIDDLQLKADAIRYSILPKLEIVIHHTIAQIDMVYGVSVFDDCSIAKSPHFRLGNRKSEIKTDFEWAIVSINGKRTYNKWHGIRKPDKTEPKIAPFSLSLELMCEGLFISLINNNVPISKDSHRKVFDFLIKYKEEIGVILNCARVFENRNYNRSDWVVTSNKTWFKFKLDNDEFDYPMVSDAIIYPIEYSVLRNVVDRLTILFPIFHSYIQIAKGERIVFADLVEKANAWLLSEESKEDEKYYDDSLSKKKFVDIEKVKDKANSRVKVLAGIRWQVFQRDNWRCVACGVKATDNDDVILHVDHILPRSKGGKDELNNYQTLCDKCNIGKSNKDDTNLKLI